MELAWLEGQTWRHLQRAMRRGPWHVFHFIGHGGFDPETEEGAIALTDDEGRKHLLGASDLALLLDDHYFLRLVFLNSCEGARGSPARSLLEHLGYPGAPVGSFAMAVWRVTTKPTEFFSTIPRRGNFRAPLIFAIICYVVSAILGDLLDLIGTGGAQNFGWSVIGAPFLAVISLFVGAGSSTYL